MRMRLEVSLLADVQSGFQQMSRGRHLREGRVRGRGVYILLPETVLKRHRAPMACRNPLGGGLEWRVGE